MIYKEFSRKVGEFEETLQKLATDITTGTLFERLPPMELWSSTEQLVTRLKGLAEDLNELMLILKPEKAHTIQQRFKAVAQSLTTFKNILFQKSNDPLANSRLAFEQLRNAVTDGSEFLVLMREIRDAPSPAIDAILRLREVSETKGTVVTVQAPDEVQSMLNRLFKHVEALRTAIMAAEKALGEAKQLLRTLQEESLKFGNASEKERLEAASKEVASEEELQKKQLSLSHFEE